MVNSPSFTFELDGVHEIALLGRGHLLIQKFQQLVHRRADGGQIGRISIADVNAARLGLLDHFLKSEDELDQVERVHLEIVSEDRLFGDLRFFTAPVINQEPLYLLVDFLPSELLLRQRNLPIFYFRFLF